MTLKHDDPAMSSPTFVATFADGTITRMTTRCPDGQLDLGLGARLSRAAYEFAQETKAACNDWWSFRNAAERRRPRGCGAPALHSQRARWRVEIAADD